MYLAPQNIPRAISVLTLGSKVVLYWNVFPKNELHKICPDLRQCTICPGTNTKEETVLARLHIGYSFITHSCFNEG